MNESSNHMYEKIEQYCLDLMDDKEKQYFEAEMAINLSLKRAVEEYTILLQTFDHQQSADFIHTSLNEIHAQSRSQTAILFNQLKLHVNRYWKTASVAASVAFVASILTFMMARSVYKKDTRAQYQTLRNEINTIKKDQKDIKNDVEDVKKIKSMVPDYPSMYTGTCFAISQNGYLVTNLHVIDGFDKIFVFTQDNIGHQSEIVATDELNDLAVLKITEEDFAFADKIPYSVRKANPNIAQRVYSLGYPKSDIVYNEGYISSITGFEGDSSRYQLELPSVPGVSGAPIIDETGNIIGVISGKQSQSEGITYAIKSKSLLNLFKKIAQRFFEQ
ncbi:MAG: trypsin-like peptidase domain-containing protein [Bacteroidetes bacterium]|nr:trypsin-like peptidase domain-containing protein [Bacteroidota bacterium]